MSRPQFAAITNSRAASAWRDRGDGDKVPIYRSSARTVEGLPELCSGVIRDVHTHQSVSISAKEPYFLERWVRDEWGRFGVRTLDAALGGAQSDLQRSAGFERAQADFARHICDHLAQLAK